MIDVRPNPTLTHIHTYIHIYNTTQTVARRFLGSIREHVPSLVSVADAGNVGVETVREAQGFVESVISKTAAGIRARLPSPAQGLETANAGVEQAGLLAERAERIAQVGCVLCLVEFVCVFLARRLIQPTQSNVTGHRRACHPRHPRAPPVPGPGRRAGQRDDREGAGLARPRGAHRRGAYACCQPCW